MGYNTTYSLTWKPTNSWQAPPICEHAPSKAKVKYCPECGKPAGSRGLDAIVAEYIETHEEMAYALNADGSAEKSCKWYEHQDDMQKMSAEIRGVVFHLEGEGEESGDIWDLFAFNGEVQKHEAQIVRVTEPKPWSSGR